MTTQNTLLIPASLIGLLCCLTFATASNSINANKLKRAYLDDKQNVHVVTVRDHHTQITNKRNSTELKLAPDNETVAWLAINNWIAEADIKPTSLYTTRQHSHFA